MARVVAERFSVPMQFVGIKDQYAESGDAQGLLEKYGLLPGDIVHAVDRVIAQKDATRHQKRTEGKRKEK